MAESFKVGEAPWETKESGFKAGEAPWELEVQGPSSATIEEKHPEITLKQRAIVKNLAQSPETGAAFLQQEGFETQLKNGNIYVRRPGELSFKALDPSGFDVQDITDVAYDIPAGVATGAATAAGGLVGNIPGAIASGAASAGGLEALRQKLGQYAGIPQDVSGKDVGVSAALGGVSPLLFGTGATAAQIAKAGISPQSQRSLVTRGIEKSFPTIARGTSGVPKEAIQTYMQRTPEVEALIAEGPDAAANLSEQTHRQIQDQFFTKKKEVGKALETSVKGSQNLITRDELFLPLEKRLTELSSSQRALTPSGKEEILALRSEIDSLKGGLPDQITPTTAWELQDIFKQNANLQNVKGSFQARYGKGATGAEKLFSDANKDAYQVVNSSLEKAASTAGQKAEYAKLSRLQEKLQKYFKDPETTERTLLQLDKGSKDFARKTVNDLDKTIGPTGIRETSDLLEAYSYFQSPELLPISSGGTTSTSRTLGLSSLFEAAGGLAGEKGRQIGRAVGSVAGGPAATKFTIKAGKAASKKAGALPARMSPWLQMGVKENVND